MARQERLVGWRGQAGQKISYYRYCRQDKDTTQDRRAGLATGKIYEVRQARHVQCTNRLIDNTDVQF
jgi:hypothetical protein